MFRSTRMLTAVAVLIAAPVGSNAAAQDVEPEADDAAVDQPVTAMEHLGRAQTLRADGELEAALAEAEAAIESDPDLTFAYLTRAQILIEWADVAGSGPDGKPTDDAEREAMSKGLRKAAADLDRYIGLADLDEAGRARIETRRDELLARAEHLESTSEPEPAQAEPELEPVEPRQELEAEVEPDPGHVDDARRPVTGPVLLGVGAAAAGASVGLAAAGLRIEQRCDSNGLCGAAWTTRTPLFAPAVAGSAIGGVLATSGAALMARGMPRRSRRIMGGMLLGLGGSAAAAGATLGGLTALRWNTVLPSDTSDLMTNQRMANAAASVLAVVPALLGSGIAVLVRRGESDRVSLGSGGIAGRF